MKDRICVAAVNGTKDSSNRRNRLPFYLQLQSSRYPPGNDVAGELNSSTSMPGTVVPNVRFGVVASLSH